MSTRRDDLILLSFNLKS